MKRFLFLILLGGATFLWALDKPHRFVELGFDVGASFANSYLTSQDLLKEQVTLDFSEMTHDLQDGLKLFFDAPAGAFLNVNLGVTWGFGLFADLDAVGQFKIPQSLMELLTRGNSLNETYAGDFGLGAAAFLEAGAWFSKDFERLRFTFRPAYYLPLAYVGTPRARYSFVTQDDGIISVSGDFTADVYLPASLDDMTGLNVEEMLNKGGIDLTLRAEYPMRHNLIVGVTLAHIPFFPAQLDYRYNMAGFFSFKSDLENIIDDFEEGMSYQIPELKTSNTEKVILRPFKIGFDAIYRPFDHRIFSLKPNLGLVFNSIYDTPVYLDFGLIAEISLFKILILDAGTHYEDMIWKQRLGLTFNFRVIEVNVGLTLQSQEFVKSFNGAGYGVDLGVRLGF